MARTRSWKPFVVVERLEGVVARATPSDGVDDHDRSGVPRPGATSGSRRSPPGEHRRRTGRCCSRSPCTSWPGSVDRPPPGLQPIHRVRQRRGHRDLGLTPGDAVADGPRVGAVERGRPGHGGDERVEPAPPRRASPATPTAGRRPSSASPPGPAVDHPGAARRAHGPDHAQVVGSGSPSSTPASHSASATSSTGLSTTAPSPYAVPWPPSSCATVARPERGTHPGRRRARRAARIHRTSLADACAPKSCAAGAGRRRCWGHGRPPARRDAPRCSCATANRSPRWRASCRGTTPAGACRRRAAAQAEALRDRLAATRRARPGRRRLHEHPAPHDRDRGDPRPRARRAHAGRGVRLVRDPRRRGRGPHVGRVQRALPRRVTTARPVPRRIPGAESWAEFAVRAGTRLRRVAEEHRGRARRGRLPRRHHRRELRRTGRPAVRAACARSPTRRRTRRSPSGSAATASGRSCATTTPPTSRGVDG